MTIYFQKTYQRGFGTYPLRAEPLRQAILAAAETGYRAFDTAQMYGNETETGAALALCREHVPEQQAETQFIH